MFLPLYQLATPIAALQASLPATVFNGAMVKKSADQTGADYTTPTAIAWQTEVFDDGGWFDSGSSATNFVVPATITKVRVGANVRVENIGASEWVELVIRKGGSTDYDGRAGMTAQISGTSGSRSVASGPISCSPGDTFQVYLANQTDTAIDVIAAQSNFWIEAVIDRTFSGAMVIKSGDQLGANYSGGVAVAWQTEVYDEGGWFDSGVSTTAFTVPSGVTKVHVGGTIRMSSGTAADWASLVVRKNGNAAFDGSCGQAAEGGLINPGRVVCSGPISCTAGDTFDVFFQVESDASINITAAQSNFWIEKVG